MISGRLISLSRRNAVLATAYGRGSRYSFLASRFSTATATSSADKSDAEANEDHDVEQQGEKVPRFEGAARGEPQRYQFQAETHKLLDIVANSLYSEKEVFCRELVSNAADALEKLRHAQLSSTEGTTLASENPLEIQISVDATKKEFALQDFGIGMTRAELVDLLGTIARSGSKAFVDSAETGDSSAAKHKIIGQFGVGFYSAFMVGKQITVFTRSATETTGHCWTSDGTGSYEISEAENVPVGTRIVIQLKDNCLEFCKESVVEALIKKYSNFVSYPVKLNGRIINTVQPLWSMEKSEITPEQHKQFYRFVSGAWDSYQYQLHYKTDAPIHIAALLYIPERHTEYMGMKRMESGTNLYSRRVLIKSKADLLPEYMRFIKGAVDSEDLAMNLSREMVQQSSTMHKLKEIMTGRVIKWLQDEAKRDTQKYEKFFSDFGSFLREGVCTTRQSKQQQELAKLLRYESSATKPGERTSLQDYISRKPAEQKSIFYLVSPTRKWAEESPYVERLLQANKQTEVLYMVGDPMDEFVAQNLHEFDGCSLVSVDSNDAALAETETKNDDSAALSEEQTARVIKLFKDTLGSALSDVKITKRPHSHPAIITGHESATVRKLMKMVPQSSGSFIEEAPQLLELNPHHAIVRGLATALEKDQPELCADVARQVFDNALIVAGIMEDPRVMVKRLNTLLERSLGVSATAPKDE